MTFLALASTAFAQAPAVVSTSPAANSFLGPFEAIRVTFAAPIAPASVNANSVSVFGRNTGAVSGMITVNAAATEISFQPNRPLLVGDYVWVDLTRAITSSGNTPLAGGYQFQFWVASAPGSGVFQQTQTYPFRMPGEGPISTYGIHAGDVDRDGTPDITAVNELSHDLRVFKSNGCSGYGAMTLVGDGFSWPSPHESADFNRDGWLDLVTGDFALGDVSVFMNDGQGNYQPPLHLNGNTFIRSVCSGDLDGDGFPDIVAGNGASTLVWINDGSGGFLPAVTITGPGSAELQVVDANEDGHLDIVGSSLSPSELWVLIGNGDGTFTQNATVVPIATQPFASAAADLNGDGHVDIVYIGPNPDLVTWFFGNGAGNFTPGGSVTAGGGPTSVQVADLDGDGDIDVVVSHYWSNYYVFLNDGTGTFAAPIILPSPAAGSCTTIADFDRDGDLDILAADEGLDIGVMFTQVGGVQGLQVASCAAALRVNQRADGAGYGGSPAVPVRVGSAVSFNLSGPAGAIGILVAGFPFEPALPLPWGLLSIDPTGPLAVLAALPIGVSGETLTSLSFPTGPIGASLALQGWVFNSGADVFSNPMQFVLVP